MSAKELYPELYPLSAAVIGYGNYGRIHAKKLHTHSGAKLAGVVDIQREHWAAAREHLPGVPVFASVTELLAEAQPDIASIAVPANAHFSVARELLLGGVHVLVEKPLTARREHALELMRLADERGLVLQPGHLERFNHTLAELHARIPDPRYVEARRLTHWRGRGADVDVVLDLMIHDIDMLMEIIDAPITDIQARGVKMFTGNWDVANAQLKFANGCTANLTASRASPQPERRLHVFSRTACALADIDEGLMLLHHCDNTGGVFTDQRFCRHEDPLAAEIDAFILAVRGHAAPHVSAADGYRAVDIALRISEAMETDEDVLERIALPLTDSNRAIAYLTREERH